MVLLEATHFVQPTFPRVSVGNKNALTASVFIHIDQAVQDNYYAMSSLSEDSGEFEMVQDGDFSITIPCIV